MISTDNLCMSCMREIGNAKQCPYCGYHANSAQIAPYLPVRTLVANRYLIGKLLDYNGEGATYIGWDLSAKKAVNIREFFPDTLAIRNSTALNLHITNGKEAIFRDCNQSFLELWVKLRRLQGLPALIHVTDVVEDYGTSYAVYDHIEGVTLREYLLSSKTGNVSWDKARQLLMPILSTLGTLHSSGIIHRGISPATLIIGRDGKVRISGFSIWQARTSRSELNAQLYPGYAAIEQYGFEGQQGPWTDIYSFGAVLYRTLVGSDPIDATERVSNDRLMVPGKIAEQLPEYVIDGLVNSLQILPDDRTRTVEQLRGEMSPAPDAPAPSRRDDSAFFTEPDTPAVRRNKKEDRSTALKAAGISAAAGLLVFVILMFTVFRDDFGFMQNWSLFNKSNGENMTESVQGGMNPVPNFAGKNYLDVTGNAVFSANFNFETQYTYSDTVAKNYIVNQSIEAGKEVPSGTTIVLYVSKGKEQITLPEDIVGSRYDDAYARLKALGFKVVRKDTEDGSYDNDEVISCSPVAGNAYDKGTTVTLMVYYVAETTTEKITLNIEDEPLVEPDPDASIVSDEPEPPEEDTPDEP